ncbi:uncharacterized protein LOC132031533 [Lycium ferocissimum]|uniref:uncharacterized protein LOC132031533 n=1 Tax=Lycium ferocissimum TaxID=112874 RepID=UPI002815973F|nr:uncharacterized protein LOC132031533 [Lycium ferocissimum]
METAFVNISGKIWLFLSEDVQGSVEIDNEQQITLKLFHQSLNCNIVLTVVYASCDAGERRVLWDSINQVSNLFDLPWLVGGDFNVISTEEEKLRGGTYTWWNGRDEEACIFKSLDRMVCNDKLLDVMPTMKQVASLEEVIKVHEEQFESSPTVQNRERLHRVQADLSRFLHLEELFWKQKSGLTWFQDGDRNSKFFHAYVKGRRKKLRVDNIQDADGNWLTNQEEISQEAVRCYQKQFEEDRIPSKFGLLKHIPTLVTEDQNHTMEMLPNEEEVKEAVFALNGESACGPDGFTGLFFQSAWEIVKLDVVDMVKAFFVGQRIARFITHTNLILILRKRSAKFLGYEANRSQAILQTKSCQGYFCMKD